jgi:hypothetical protein
LTGLDVFVAFCPPPAAAAECSGLATGITYDNGLLLSLLNQIRYHPVTTIGVEAQATKLLFHLVNLKWRVFSCVKGRSPLPCIGVPGKNNWFNLLTQPPHQVKPAVPVGEEALTQRRFDATELIVEPRRPSLLKLLFKVFTHVSGLCHRIILGYGMLVTQCLHPPSTAECSWLPGKPSFWRPISNDAVIP